MKTFESVGWRGYSAALSDGCRRERVPLSGTFELTPMCNFRCRMCYVRLDPDQICERGRLHTAEEWLSLGRRVCEAGTLYLLLTGGEVFTRRDFREIYEGLCGMGFLISIYSNGYLLNDETVSWLRRMPPYRLRITLYGTSDETYRRVCGIADGFTVVKSNLDRLRQAGIRFSLAMTIIKDNEEEAEEAAALAASYGVSFEATREVLSPLPGVRSDAAEARCRLSSLFRTEAGQPVTRVGRLVKKDPCDAFAGCGSARKGYWVTWNGNMQLCSMMTGIREDAFSGDPAAAFARLCERLTSVRHPEKCAGCRYFHFCPSCPGIFTSETGDPETTCAYLCEKARYLYETFSADAVTDISHEK